MKFIKYKFTSVFKNTSNFTYFFVSLILYSISFFMSIRHWFARLELGIDLSDESFNLRQLDERLLGNQKYLMPYTDILYYMYKLSGKDIFMYRLSGIIIVLTISIAPLLFVIFHFFKMDYFSNVRLLFAQLLSLSVLLIPSSFGYFLLTPGYQWLISIGHTMIFSSVLFIFRRPFNKILLILSLLLLNLGLLFIMLGRFSSGILIFLIVAFYIVALKKELPKHFFYSFLTCLILLLIFFVNINYLHKISYLYKLQQAVSSNSIFSEITDTLKGVLLFFLVLIIQFLFAKILIRFASHINLLGFFVFVMINVFISNYTFELWTIYFTYAENFLIFLFTYLTGLILAILGMRFNHLLFIFSFGIIPILSNFGSSNPIFANEQPYYQSAIYLIVSSLFIISKPISRIKLVKGLMMILLVILIIFINSQREKSYGKSLNIGNSLVSSKYDNLLYSPNKVINMDFFRFNAIENGIRFEDKVLDLSYWHPGLSQILQIRSIPAGQADKFFKPSLASQFESFNPRNENLFNRFNTSFMFLSVPSEAVSQENIELNRCYPMAIFLKHDSELQVILKNSGPYNVKMISYYVSSKEDMTLYPDYGILVKDCN